VTHRLLLWTIPRSISTAFERAFLQRGDTRVRHEPYGGPFYFGPERQSTRYRDRAVDSSLTYAHIDLELLADHAEDLLFVKDMAYHVENHDRLEPVLSAFDNTFLIRDPRKAIRSLHRMSIDTERTGWSYFDPNEAGYRQLRAVFERVMESSGKPPVVVDADVLQDNPERVLRRYCELLGLDFLPAMLEWKPRKIDEWRVWQGWHESAEDSTGFQPPSPISSEPMEPDVEACVASAIPHYEALRTYAI